jgi:hypothetical protein
MLLCVLSYAVAEGPVLFFNFDQADQNILLANTEFGVEMFGNGGVEGSFHFGGAAFVEGDLDEDDAVGAGDAEVFRIVDKGVVVMLGDDLEVVLGRDVEGGDHLEINGFPYFPASVGGGAFHESDTYQRHVHWTVLEGAGVQEMFRGGVAFPVSSSRYFDL